MAITEKEFDAMFSKISGGGSKTPAVSNGNTSTSASTSTNAPKNVNKTYGKITEKEFDAIFDSIQNPSRYDANGVAIKEDADNPTLGVGSSLDDLKYTSGKMKVRTLENGKFTDYKDTVVNEPKLYEGLGTADKVKSFTPNTTIPILKTEPKTEHKTVTGNGNVSDMFALAGIDHSKPKTEVTQTPVVEQTVEAAPKVEPFSDKDRELINYYENALGGTNNLWDTLKAFPASFFSLGNSEYDRLNAKKREIYDDYRIAKDKSIADFIDKYAKDETLNDIEKLRKMREYGISNDDLAEYMEHQKNVADAEAKAQMTDNNGVLGFFQQPIYNLYGGLKSAAGTIYDTLSGNKVGTSRNMNRERDIAKAIGSENAKNIDNAIDNDFLSGVAQGAYNAGNTAIDMGANIALGGAIGGAVGATKIASEVAKLGSTATKILMGLGSFANKAQENAEKGVSNNANLISSLGAGLATYLSEKLGVEPLMTGNFQASTVRQAVTNFLKQGTSEGAEEGLEDLINFVTDSIVLGDKSDFRQTLSAYKQNGLSDTDAIYSAVVDTLNNTMYDIGMGFAVGGTLGGIKTIADTVISKRSSASDAKVPSIADNQVDNINPDTKAPDMATKNPSVNAEPISTNPAVSDTPTSAYKADTDTLTNHTENVESVYGNAPNMANYGSRPNLEQGNDFKREFGTNTTANDAFYSNVEGAQEAIRQAIDEGMFDRGVVTEAKSVAEAKEYLDNDFNAEKNRIENAKTISDGVETDEAVIISHKLAEEGAQTGDFTEFKQWISDVSKKFSNTARALQALSKWSRTPEGIVAQIETAVNNSKKNYFKQDEKGNASKHAEEAKAIDYAAESISEISECVTKANENTISDSEVKMQKTSNASRTLPKEQRISDYELKYELEYFLKNGEFFEIPEKIADEKVRLETSKELSSVLSDIGNDKTLTPLQSKKPLTVEEHAERIRNTLANETAPILRDMSEENINTLARLVYRSANKELPKEQRITKSDLRYEIEYFLENGVFFEMPEIKEGETRKMPTNPIIKDALGLNTDASVEAEKANKQPKTHEQIVEEVKNSLMNESASVEAISGKIRKEFTDSDYEYIATMIEKGYSKDKITDELQRRIATGSFSMSDEDIKTILDIFNKTKDMPDSEQRTELENQAYAIAAKYLPEATFMEKWNAWRYMAMLANPRTHFRNMIGNSLFGAVTDIKDNVAALIEIAYARNHDIERTKSILTRADKGLVDACEKDFFKNAYEKATRGDKYNVKNELENAKRIFKNDKLEKFRTKNGDFLTAEDNMAIKRKYRRTLASYLKANEKDASIFNSNNEADIKFLEKARDYAIKQAQIATFHEDSKVANWLSKSSKELAESDSIPLNALGFAVESTVPFKKTPANVLKQGAVEYNPLVETVRVISQIKNKADANEVIDSFAKGFTGAGIMALGWWLFENGLLHSGSDDKKEDEFLGKQEYSLKIPGTNYSYTLDWLSPSALPLFVGAELAKTFDGDAFALDSLLSVANPVVEMTMLQGLRDTINSVASFTNSDNKQNIIDLAFNISSGYAQQGVPTLLGQLARTVDSTRRQPITESEGTLGNIEYQGRKAANKVPFLGMINEPFVDEFGNRVENSGGNFLGRFVSNFISPGYIKEENTDPLKDTLVYLEAEPTKFSRKINVAGEEEKVKLSNSEFTKYKEISGKTDEELLRALTNNSNFNLLTYEEKNKVASDMHSESQTIGQDAIGKPKNDNTATELYKKYGAEGYANYRIIKKLKSRDGVSTFDAVNMLNGVSPAQKGEFLHDIDRNNIANNSIYENYGADMLYNWYRFKNAADTNADGKVGNGEFETYISENGNAFDVRSLLAFGENVYSDTKTKGTARERAEQAVYTYVPYLK